MATSPAPSGRRLRTGGLFALIVGAWALVLMPGLWWPGYLDSPIGLLAAMPYLSIYLFHAVGVPGLLQNGGLCGWGWCPPTLFGWGFLGAVWGAVAWGLARLIHRARSR
ncbi:MAG: hypothetical protein IV093_05840 [Rubrivivax sp.]|nr:hypothetical protein [Rubrivivax sp.]